MQPAPTRAEGGGGATELTGGHPTLDPATFNADEWENVGGSMPQADMPLGAVYALFDGSVVQKTGDNEGWCCTRDDGGSEGTTLHALASVTVSY
jgi:hypothetical protein